MGQKQFGDPGHGVYINYQGTKNQKYLLYMDNL